MNKTVKIIIYFIIVSSLLFLDYIVFLHVIKSIFEYDYNQLVNMVRPWFTIIGIIITGSIAIYVMNRNHAHQNDLKQLDSEINDDMQLRKAAIILNEIDAICRTYAKAFKTSEIINEIGPNKLIEICEEIISECKKVREIDVNFNSQLYEETINTISKLMILIREAEITLVINMHNTSFQKLNDIFTEASVLTTKYIEDSEYITKVDK
ncbi:hypothetical protein [Mammaliicoccus fleurettii]|uniref:hypothetical protein n=1 Tax=Mammaliicoccus fleurettii TaxID=150056 RepID=UPI002DBDDB20|nr:hypothetical protein [Mammaliicoccus fleurettii]MEB7723400.1 hypothetical protein [Mammaliicoccus fleurettii]